MQVTSDCKQPPVEMRFCAWKITFNMHFSEINDRVLHKFQRLVAVYFTHTHTQTDTHTHTHTHTYTQTHTHTHTQTDIHTHARTQTHAHTYTHRHTHAHTQTHARARTHTHTHRTLRRHCCYFFLGVPYQLIFTVGVIKQVRGSDKKLYKVVKISRF
jgi:hypothetical protein